MLPDDPRHGERRGYYAHRKDGEQACDACLRAVAGMQARYDLNKSRGISGRTNPIGVQRRLRALYALGHTWTALAPHLGATEKAVQKLASEERVYVYTGTLARVTEIYDRLSMTRPDGPFATVARRRAIEKGWAPPLAWDDDEIDDPASKPSGVKELQRFSSRCPDLDLDAEDWMRRIMAGQRPEPHWPKRHIREQIVAIWPETGLSLNELERRTGWQPARYRQEGAA